MKSAVRVTIAGLTIGLEPILLYLNTKIWLLKEGGEDAGRFSRSLGSVYSVPVPFCRSFAARFGLHVITGILADGVGRLQGFKDRHGSVKSRCIVRPALKQQPAVQ